MNDAYIVDAGGAPFGRGGYSRSVTLRPSTMEAS
jgi:hypothetical protein